jgi:F-type H+-transporting ATPase subunit b
MELDATTFVLEIINFLVLLWLLNRLLYRPVRAALDTRAQAQANRQQALDERQAGIDAEAASLAQGKAELDARRRAAEAELADEIATLRQNRLAALARELDVEREKAKARLAQQQQFAAAQQEGEFRERAARFVAGYLARLASPAMEAAVVELFLGDLGEQSGPAREALRDGWSDRGEAPPSVEVSTAFPPSEMIRTRVEAQIEALMGASARTRWRIDPQLLAGICIHLPGHLLEASLRRGVDAFLPPAA